MTVAEIWLKADRLGAKLEAALKARGASGDRGFDFRLAVRDGVIEVTRRSSACKSLQIDSSFDGTPVRVLDAPAGGRGGE